MTRQSETFMTAREAREQAEKHSLPYDILAQIDVEITNACALGRFDTSYWLNVEYERTVRKIIQNLQYRGFNVTRSSDDWRQICIDWKEERED